MAQSVVNVGSASNRGSSITIALGATATTGNRLVAGLLRRNGGATPNTPTGYAVLDTFATSGRTVDIFEKVSDGTETDVVITSGNTIQQCGWLYELAETSNTVNQVENTPVSGTSTTVVFNGVLTTAAEVIALAFGALEDDDFSGDAWSNSFTKQANFEVATGPGADMSAGSSSRVLTVTGTEGTTLSTSAGGADETWGTLIYLEIEAVVTPQAIAATVTATATLTPVIIFAQSITANVTATAVFSKTIKKTILAAVTSVVFLNRKISKTISTTVTATPTFTKQISKTISATVTATATIINALKFTQVISATATFLASLVSLFIPAPPVLVSRSMFTGLKWISETSASIAASGSYAVAITSRRIPLDMEFVHDISSGSLTLYEDATFTGGAPILPINANRNVGSNPTTTIIDAVTRTGGTQILQDPLLIENTTMKLGRIILKEDATYIIEVQNDDPGSRSAALTMRYTERRIGL